jgi:hypothetical protein
MLKAAIKASPPPLSARIYARGSEPEQTRSCPVRAGIVITFPASTELLAAMSYQHKMNHLGSISPISRRRFAVREYCQAIRNFEKSPTYVYQCF